MTDHHMSNDHSVQTPTIPHSFTLNLKPTCFTSPFHKTLFLIQDCIHRQGLRSAYPTLCCKGIPVFPKMWVLPSGTLSQILNLIFPLFVMACWMLKCCQQYLNIVVYNNHCAHQLTKHLLNVM